MSRINRARPLGAERLLVDVSAHRLPQLGQEFCEAHQLVELGLLLRRTKVRVVQILAAPGLVDSSGLELGFGRGEIQTSFQAGGMTSDSMRATLPGSVMRFPRASS